MDVTQSSIVTNSEKGGFILTQRAIINWIAVLSFFPFFAFIPGLTAEVQPYCYLVTFAFILLFRQKLPYGYYWFIGIVLAYFMYYFIRYFLRSPDFSALPHLIIYLGPPLFFYVMYRHFDKINIRVLHMVYYVWVSVGLLQHYFSFFFSITGLKYILVFLMPRFKVEALTEFGDRGVTSLSNEPSHAGIIFFTLFIILIYRYLKGETGTKHFLLDCLLFIMSLVSNASLTMFLSAFVLVLALVYHTRSYFKFTGILILLVLPFLFFDFGFRIIGLIRLAPDMFEQAGGNIYKIVIGPYMGSIREFSTWVGIKSAFYHFWGNGYYSSLTEFVPVAQGMHIDLSEVSFFDFMYNGSYVNMKPYGYGAFLLFEIGVIPFLLINGICIKLLLNATRRPGPYKRLGVFLSVVLLLFINFSTLASLPSYWFAFIVALHIIPLPAKNAPGITNVSKTAAA